MASQSEPSVSRMCSNNRCLKISGFLKVCWPVKEAQEDPKRPRRWLAEAPKRAPGPVPERALGPKNGFQTQMS